MAAALSPLSPHFQRPYMVDLSTPTAIYHTTPGTPRHTPLTLPPNLYTVTRPHLSRNFPTYSRRAR